MVLTNTIVGFDDCEQVELVSTWLVCGQLKFGVVAMRSVTGLSMMSNVPL